MTAPTVAPVVDAKNQELTEKALTHEQKAEALVVSSDEQRTAAAEYLLVVADLRREVEDHHAPIIKAAHAAHKAAIAACNKLLVPLQKAEEILKSRIGAYDLKKRQEAEAERQRLLAQQREAEMAARRAQQEAERQAAEARRKAEEEARKAHEAEIEKQIELAEANNASAAEIQAIIDTPTPPVQPMYVPPPPAVVPVAVFVPPPMVKEPPKVQGVKSLVNYKAEVYDVKALCRAVADGTQPEELIAPNLVALNRMAKAAPKSLNIPGVRVVEGTVISAGRRA